MQQTHGHYPSWDAPWDKMAGTAATIQQIQLPPLWNASVHIMTNCTRAETAKMVQLEYFSGFASCHSGKRLRACHSVWFYKFWPLGRSRKNESLGKQRISGLWIKSLFFSFAMCFRPTSVKWAHFTICSGPATEYMHLQGLFCPLFFGSYWPNVLHSS